MLSVAIICKNEERIIADCLKQAAKLADEIVVVDSGSTDKTVEIARAYTPKVIHHDWQGYAKQKNFSLSQCTNEWVLSLDADEVLSDELIAEIRSLDFSKPGYQIARKLYIGKRFIRWGGYYPDYQLRLVRRSQARFSNSPVHESIELYDEESKSYSKDRKHCPRLRNALNHFSYENPEEMDKAFANFARLAHKKNNILSALIKAAFTFVNKYFLQLGLLEGSLGLRLAWIHTKYTFKKYC